MNRLGVVALAGLLLGGCVTDVHQARPEHWSASFPDVSVASGGQLIRVVTPFAEPLGRTTSSAVIEANEHALYVVPVDDQPISMFISEGGSELSSISVTLSPREGGPLVVDLAEMTNRAVEKADSKVQASLPPAEKTAGVSIEIEEGPSWGRPCKTCRDHDDEGDGYDGGKW